MGFFKFFFFFLLQSQRSILFLLRCSDPTSTDDYSHSRNPIIILLRIISDANFLQFYFIFSLALIDFFIFAEHVKSEIQELRMSDGLLINQTRTLNDFSECVEALHDTIDGIVADFISVQ